MAEDESTWTKLAEALATARRGGRRDVPYRAPSGAEGAAFGAWVRAGATGIAAPPGFEVERIGSFAVIREASGARRGAGAVVLRTEGAGSLVVEAPHTFFDGRTLEIALELFRRSDARALLLNTVHRYGGQGPDDEEVDREGAPTDVAHASSSFFLEAHRALASGSAVQIHGFADRKAPGHAAIVSGARTSFDPKPVTARLAPLLRDTGRVSSYPDEVGTLGGTTNVQARDSASRALPFVHVELSRTARERLASDGALRRRFAEALADSLGAKAR